MEKVKINPKTFLYPMPTTLVGAKVSGKPNYLAIANCGILNRNPPIISIALSKTRYTNIGIMEYRSFSVNIPSIQMVKITDYCGIFTGHKVDKSGLFESFYGKMETAPMIRECALNLACKLIQTLEFPKTYVFIGEIVEAYAEEQYLTNGVPDIQKINPILFSMPDKNYWKVGERIAQAFHVGLEFKSNK
jgi:flavin reductase (DIM6/NTAB) family NADH-FMN oxidoreductase RutF